ncbi:MAG: hypothetical protein IJZ80_04295 [Clostridia bacterium]|nr:hypothetical protein [Clostridia bacterium]
MQKFDFLNGRIVYTEGESYSLIEREAAFSLWQKMNLRFGTAPTVCVDAGDAPAIRFARGDNANLCCVREDGRDIILTAASASGYDKVTDLFLSLFNGNGDFVYDGKIALCEDVADASLAREYGNLRILYHNIFGYDRKPTIDPARRFAFQTYLYREYRAPLLCLQEFDKRPRELMAPMLEAAGYREVEVDYSALGKNCSPIFYDPTRLALIDCGFCPFTYISAANPAVCNNANTKNFTWGVFEDKRLQKRLTVISLHFYYAADAVCDRMECAESNLARIRNAEELLSVIQKEILPKYPTLPIVFGGDLNACYAHATWPSVLSSVTKGRTVLDLLSDWEGVCAAQKHAAVFADDHITCHAYPTYDAALGYYDYCADLSGTSFDGAIDHVYTYGEGIRPMTFDILDSSIARKCSDHCPVLVDLELR